tara:strand:- start:3305 stop:5167 length:1863 start_codon:yes stop_codon:yes gene_type:complete
MSSFSSNINVTGLQSLINQNTQDLLAGYNADILNTSQKEQEQHETNIPIGMEMINLGMKSGRIEKLWEGQKSKLFSKIGDTQLSTHLKNGKGMLEAIKKKGAKGAFDEVSRQLKSGEMDLTDIPGIGKLHKALTDKYSSYEEAKADLGSKLEGLGKGGRLRLKKAFDDSTTGNIGAGSARDLLSDMSPDLVQVGEGRILGRRDDLVQVGEGRILGRDDKLPAPIKTARIEKPIRQKGESRTSFGKRVNRYNTQEGNEGRKPYVPNVKEMREPEEAPSEELLQHRDELKKIASQSTQREEPAQKEEPAPEEPAPEPTPEDEPTPTEPELPSADQSSVIIEKESSTATPTTDLPTATRTFDTTDPLNGVGSWERVKNAYSTSLGYATRKYNSLKNTYNANKDMFNTLRKNPSDGVRSVSKTFTPTSEVEEEEEGTSAELEEKIKQLTAKYSDTGGITKGGQPSGKNILTGTPEDELFFSSNISDDVNSAKGIRTLIKQRLSGQKLTPIAKPIQPEPVKRSYQRPQPRSTFLNDTDKIALEKKLQTGGRQATMRRRSTNPAYRARNINTEEQTAKIQSTRLVNPVETPSTLRMTDIEPPTLPPVAPEEEGMSSSFRTPFEDVL